jgi:hypothetical protein
MVERDFLRKTAAPGPKAIGAATFVGRKADN